MVSRYLMPVGRVADYGSTISWRTPQNDVSVDGVSGHGVEEVVPGRLEEAAGQAGLPVSNGQEGHRGDVADKPVVKSMMPKDLLADLEKCDRTMEFLEQKEVKLSDSEMLDEFRQMIPRSRNMFHNPEWFGAGLSEFQNMLNQRVDNLAQQQGVGMFAPSQPYTARMRG